jgi:spoIIIJ-associated protein
MVPRNPLSPVVRELTEALLERMGTPGDVEARQEGRTVHVQIATGATDGLLIGRRGETLEALQHLILRLAGRRLGQKIGNVRVDVAGYRDRRDAQLVRLAETLAEKVRRSGRRAMTEPLAPAERRVVHRALADESGISTHAGGDGVNKRVIITPRGRRGSRSRDR